MNRVCILPLLLTVACDAKSDETAAAAADSARTTATAMTSGLPSGTFCAEDQPGACYDIDAGSMKLTLMMNGNRGGVYNLTKQADGSYTFSMAADDRVEIHIVDANTLTAGFGPKTTRLKRKQ